MKDIKNVSLRRREFLVLNAAAAGSFILGFSMPAAARSTTEPSNAGAGAALNAFIEIDPTGTVTLLSPYAEMGQGIYTALSMLVAEELDVDMANMRARHAPIGQEYRLLFGGHARLTVGSLSMRSSFEPLRRAGATARVMLVQAAAEKWQTKPDQITTASGTLVHTPTGRKLSYGEVAPLASRLQAPTDIKLKNPSEYKLLGKSTARIDIESKTNGRAEFASDLKADNMLIAAVRQSPQYDAEITRLDAARALKMPGVAAVERIPNGVAVLADNYWHAARALEAVDVEFGTPPGPVSSSTAYREALLAGIREQGVVAEESGEVDDVFANAENVIEAEYHVPFLAHATMEPMACSALIEKGRCTVWAPTQAPDYAVAAIAGVTGLSEEVIDIQTPYLGCGLGRRGLPDFVVQAAVLANKHQGRVIKVIWSREEDMRHDFYRPMNAGRYRAVLDEDGNPQAIHGVIAGDGPDRRHVHTEEPLELDESVVEGALHQPYTYARRIEYVYGYAPAPIGWWRSVGHSYNAYYIESFIDEMAHAAAADPVDYRRRLLGGDQPRSLAILNKVAEMAGWRSSTWQDETGRRHAMGVALHSSLDSICGMVADVSLDEDGLPRVHRVWCAVDCGFAVNPINVIMQVEGGISTGLSATLVEELTVEDGQTVNGNFHDYPILTAQQMPDIETEIIDSGARIGGIGEVSTPLVAPAVCNALFTLTGVRIRSLPLAGHRQPLKNAVNGQAA